MDRGGGEGLEELGDIYAAAAMPETPAVRSARLLAGLLDLIGADVGFLGRLSEDGRTLDVFRVTPFSDNLVRLAFPVDSPYPLAYAVRNERPVFIASNEQLECDHPGLVRVDPEDHACATVPLLSTDGRLLGAINVAFEDPHEFTDDERILIEASARRCAAVLDD
ncbi:MAG TPA: GAF domain-containing protein [Gaiellaceae bacterium]